MKRLSAVIVTLLLATVSRSVAVVPTCPAGKFGIQGTLTLPGPADTSWVDCVFFDAVGGELYPDGFQAYYQSSGAFDYPCHALSDTAVIPAGAATVLCHTPDATAPEQDRFLQFPVTSGAYVVANLVVGALPGSTTTTSTTNAGTTSTTTSTTVPPACGGSCDDIDPCTDDTCDPLTNACTHVTVVGLARVTCACDRQPPAACAGAFLPRKVSKPQFAACAKLRTVAPDETPKRLRKLNRVVRAQTKIAARAALASSRKGQLTGECAAAVSNWMNEIAGAPGLLTP